MSDINDTIKPSCLGCGRTMTAWGSTLCSRCKQLLRMEIRAADEAKRRRRTELGTVGDERRAAEIKASADRFSALVREEAGCPRRAG